MYSKVFAGPEKKTTEELLSILLSGFICIVLVLGLLLLLLLLNYDCHNFKISFRLWCLVSKFIDLLFLLQFDFILIVTFISLSTFAKMI